MEGRSPRGLTVKRAVALGLPTLLVAFAISAIVGHLATEAGKPYNWEVAGVFGTALGTVLLAAATGALAWTTSEDVRATWVLAEVAREEVQHAGSQVTEMKRQVEASQNQVTVSQEQVAVAQHTLQAQIRPVLVDVPLELSIFEPAIFPDRDAIAVSRGAVHVHIGSDEVLVSVPVRNAGAGLAMIRGAEMRTATAHPPAALAIDRPNLPPGEYARVGFRAAVLDPAYGPIVEAMRAGNFSVVVAYADLAGQQLTHSRFDIYARPMAHTGWEVRQVHLEQPGSGTPFAGSAPAF